MVIEMNRLYIENQTNGGGGQTYKQYLTQLVPGKMPADSVLKLSDVDCGGVGVLTVVLGHRRRTGCSPHPAGSSFYSLATGFTGYILFRRPAHS